ncbi:MAG TPA: IS630 transposase-related protein [Planctomycetaceae bacterium]|jgi:transposase|nr:IS630 transposase-related protein [Planctomycetaceae bacterium]
MGPLSMDLRKRIVQAYESGEGSHARLAKRFAVSRAVVGKLTRQHRGLGTLEPQMHRRGRKPAIAGEKEQQLRQHLHDHPDATLQERIDTLKIDCSVKTMWQTLRRWGWHYKKVIARRRTAPPRRRQVAR